jgi:hypothetical protein
VHRAGRCAVPWGLEPQPPARGVTEDATEAASFGARCLPF